jgi:predicted GIY-YIG superfamily endonuclease
MTSKPWSLYLLYHTASKRTYLGVTTDVDRRLRQHRGELTGGARFTTRIQASFPQGEWILVAVLSTFPNQSEVTRWERLLKLKTVGIKARFKAMENIAKGEYPDSFSQRMREKYEIPDVILKVFDNAIDVFVVLT